MKIAIYIMLALTGFSSCVNSKLNAKYINEENIDTESCSYKNWEVKKDSAFFTNLDSINKERWAYVKWKNCILKSMQELDTSSLFDEKSQEAKYIFESIRPDVYNYMLDNLKFKENAEFRSLMLLETDGLGINLQMVLLDSTHNFNSLLISNLICLEYYHYTSTNVCINEKYQSYLSMIKNPKLPIGFSKSLYYLFFVIYFEKNELKAFSLSNPYSLDEINFLNNNYKPTKIDLTDKFGCKK